MATAAARSGPRAWIAAFLVLEGFIAGLAVACGLLGSWEDRLVDRVVAVAVEGAPDGSPQARALGIMDAVHGLLKPRLRFASKSGSIRPAGMQSTDSESAMPAGYCGSFAHVLARSLQRAGFEVKIGQTLASGVWGGHIVVVARIDDRWVILDPLYNLAFRDPSGKLLGFDEIHRDWDTLKAQCPDGYDLSYNYEGIRFTNWRWLPVDWLGPWTRELSVRTWFLNIYWSWCVVLCGCLAAALALHLWFARRQRRTLGAP